MNQKTIMFVEDDARLRALTRDYLVQHKFKVIALENSGEVKSLISKIDVDLIILDVMLPGIDGFELCKLLREHYVGPLLFLTAKTDMSDELLGFELGADDYITKPVEPSVLVARINALLRRTNSVKSKFFDQNTMQFGKLTIERNARWVQFDGKEIALTSHEFDLLLILAERAGSVVDRDTIYTEIIGREYDGLDRSADVRISRLRKKLGDNSQQPFRIKTIWGKGFFFVESAWD